mmetsp:Transcript_50810/g.42733  ORF Transcript_50810/g.42733 Transcript_50810/m.42733 type:complete len:129 (-) Transcript_50810:813-1199(-)
MLLSSQQSPDIQNEQDTLEDEESDEEEAGGVEKEVVTPAGPIIAVVKTDIDKGVFRGNAFAGELGNTYSKDAVEILMDLSDMTIGETVTEKIENMVWPCRESKEPCTPEEFFKSKGYEAAFLQGKKTE